MNSARSNTNHLDRHLPSAFQNTSRDVSSVQVFEVESWKLQASGLNRLPSLGPPSAIMLHTEAPMS